MKTKTKLAMAVAVMNLALTLPLWYLTQYLILDSIKASTLLWVLYWIQVPIAIASTFISKFLELLFGNMWNDNEFDEDKE
jgi:hypothetical protein